MATPSTRHTAEVVIGIQRKYDEVSASVSSTAPSTATQAMKLMASGRQLTVARQYSGVSTLNQTRLREQTGADMTTSRNQKPPWEGL
jgi:hypothetical protein